MILRPLSECGWRYEQPPVLMVVGIQEGCINHALLTAQAVANDGLPLNGLGGESYQLGLAHYAEIIDAWEKLPAPLIGELTSTCCAPSSVSWAVCLSMLGSVLAVDELRRIVRAESTDATTIGNQQTGE